MARAEAAGPSGASDLPFGRLCPAARQSVSGHARLIAQPAYQKLLAAEPLLQAADPGPHRHLPGRSSAWRASSSSTSSSSTASMRRASMIAHDRHRCSPPSSTPRRATSRLSTMRPPQHARRCAAAGRDQRRPAHLRHRSATAWSSPPRRARSSTRACRSRYLIGEAQPLTTFGARAGVLEIALADESRRLRHRAPSRRAARRGRRDRADRQSCSTTGGPTSR